MRVRWNPRALVQLEAIHAYIAEHNPRAATGVIERIRATAMLLGDAPLIGQRTDNQDVRSIPANPYPYRLFYRIVVSRDEVRILRVRHAKRRPLPTR
jgi:addiction module RelE/StbE family toxin